MTNMLLSHLHSLFQECYSIVEKKNHDYAGNEDPLKNFRLSEYLGVTTTERAILVRMMDKVARLANVLNSGAEVKEETLHDTIVDLINYAAILDFYLKTERGDLDD